jgi:hypothetical protein
LAQNHIKGCGCRFCAAGKTISNGEVTLANYISTITNNRRNIRDLLSGGEIDIVVDSKKIGIEYHGLYWHSFNRIETKHERYKHYNKLELALNNGYSLIQIYENEWLTKQEIVKSMLAIRLGMVSRRIYARNCSVIEVSDNTAADFFNTNHLQGHRKSTKYIGLVYKNELVVLASFSIIGGRCELIRFCSCLHTIVVGGLSKLIKRSCYSKIFTYVDRRYSSSASSYLAVNFQLVGTTPPGYCYCKGLKTFPRQMFQKHKLPGLLSDFCIDRTEAENMFANDYRRLWDAGHYKMEWCSQ